jgi:hypothetical protein
MLETIAAWLHWVALTGTVFAGIALAAISLRNSNTKDALEISQLIGSDEHNFYALPSGAGAERFKLSVTPEKIAETVSRPNFIYCLAEHQGAIVGAVGIRDKIHLAASICRTRLPGATHWEITMGKSLFKGD